MIALSKELLNCKELRPLMSRLTAKSASLVSGPDGIHKAHLAAALRRETGRVVIAVVSDESELGRFRMDISALTGESVYALPSREFTFYDSEIVSREVEHERIRSLFALSANLAGVVVCTPDGLMQRTVGNVSDWGLHLKMGDTIQPEELIRRLTELGYERTEQVEGIGQFARRGGILDFYSPSLETPVRMEFFGNEIDRIGTFSAEDQRVIGNIRAVSILPVAESLVSLHPGGEAGFLEDLRGIHDRLAKRKTTPPALLQRLEQDFEHINNGLKLQAADRYMQLIYGKDATVGADYIPDNAIIVLCEPHRLEEKAKNYLWRINEDTSALLESGVISGELSHFYKDWDGCLRVFDKQQRSVVMLDSFRGAAYPFNPRITLTLTAKQLPSYGGSLPTAADDINRYIKDKYRVVVLCGDERKAKAMMDFLEEQKISASLDYSLNSLPSVGQCVISIGGLSAGMEYPGLNLTVITEGQLFSHAAQNANQQAHSRLRKRKGSVPSKNKKKLQSYSDLGVGDFVVHELHGIGRFLGMVKITTDGVEKEYVQIAYRGTDKVYVPATQLDMVSKYIGGGGDEGGHVRLSKLGGTDWTKAKARAKAAAKDLAQGLINLYAERVKRPGFAFSRDHGLQADFEEAFPYNETDDQLKAIAEIKADMEKATPMDRLLCGDVGFGKTEVALRAVMKCVNDGKQAALLVPTTVLAQQHYVTASQRFANLAVKIEVLSRFRSTREINSALQSIRAGSVDVVIGTHRILSKDIQFKDLGLLIVDEEQRFGVSHKEKLKLLSKQVDVLTMSATPIPRTLNMALAGIRDMSTIEEPPAGRFPVQTYVLEHDWSVIADAVRREIGRGGQVYYLHNRIETIDKTAMRLREAVNIPELSVGIAHGGMGEEELSGVMERVGDGSVQVLVCTTIIEAGIDIPNVNTLIIEDADRLGLSQLHQIRGRVGRGTRHAFAYFTFRQGKVLSEISTKRLSTIREFAAFNSGVKIALRDLEIRGAGNLLGAEQSGHIAGVGFDMYLKLLEEAVLEEKGTPVKRKPTCSADLSVSASIPEKYISSSEQRIDIYRRIALIDDTDDAEDMEDELQDRYGNLPDSVRELIRVALLRAEAAEVGIADISQRGGNLIFRLKELAPEMLGLLMADREFSRRVKLELSAEAPTFTYKLKSGMPVINEALEFVRKFTNKENAK
ncbi:MAG: transcription-repair coupling factor [Oscillospiraceae bacterium]|jgi:transcription-repair coupling factor (superfamily II helicase)|nr:transcription-repair coupling factor [Oscillospiraceae bacterium]